MSGVVALGLLIRLSEILAGKYIILGLFFVEEEKMIESEINNECLNIDEYFDSRSILLGAKKINLCGILLYKISVVTHIYIFQINFVLILVWFGL